MNLSKKKPKNISGFHFKAVSTANREVRYLYKHIHWSKSFTYFLYRGSMIWCMTLQMASATGWCATAKNGGRRSRRMRACFQSPMRRRASTNPSFWFLAFCRNQNSNKNLKKVKKSRKFDTEKRHFARTSHVAIPFVDHHFIWFVIWNHKHFSCILWQFVVGNCALM